MTFEFSHTEALTGWKHLQKRMAFEEGICSTPTGRQSFELRQRAHAQYKRGEAALAFALCEEAAGLFSADDPGPAAAMAWFDLARCYEYRTDGVRADNLRAAEALFRRALASPFLAKDPHRMGTVRDALASCLRHLAYVEHGAERDTLLAEATKLFEEAVTIALSTGLSGTEDVVSFSHNLANCLAQQGNFHGALFALDRAEAYARRLGRVTTPIEAAEYLSRVLVQAARYREERGHDGDVAQAKRQLQEAMDVQHPDWVDMAQMRLARLLLRDPPASKDEALALLRRVRRDRLRPNALPELVSLYVDAGLRKEALVLLHEQLQAAMARWRNAMADHVADHCAAEAQQAAHQAARLHLEEEDALEAFFTLEDVSGLRFVEAIEVGCRLAQTPISRVVAAHHHARSLLAGTLEALAARLAHGLIRLDQQRATMERRADHPDAPQGALPALDRRLIDIVELAEKHPDPVGFLRQESRRAAEEVKRLTHKLTELDPERDSSSDKPWRFRLTREVLRDILREYPGHAFIRLSFAEDLLVISTWLEGDEVVARHHRVPVPEGLFRLLRDYERDPADAPLDRLARIQVAFEAIDLSPALPPKRMTHGVLLPSFLGFFLPLGALGPRGRTPLDRFDALSWMPCLAQLFIRQVPLGPREGVVSVAPGETRHHAFAFGVPLPGETRLEGPGATEDRVLSVAAVADVLCLYTHGEHTSPRGPHVQLYGGDYLSEPDYGDNGWAGMERIELWACQSGVNVPTDPLTTAVDEAFGLDVEFVRHGVRSAIGTLWPVPDLVTACLVRHFRRGLLRGLPAPRALADAQRFWRDEGAQSLLDHLMNTGSPEEGLRSFQATLGAGAELPLDEADLEALLGPVASPAENRQARIEARVRRLSHPLAWAGFRFVGVAERRPIGQYDPDLFRPITAEEQAEGERIVAETLRVDPDPGPRMSFADCVEQWLAEARQLDSEAHPSPEQAIRVARLYRDRIVSCQRHNHFAGLAWLHEAMVALKWTHQGARRREARNRLEVEAAWLWIEVARGDAISITDLLLARPHPIALTRAKRLLDRVPENDHVRVARAWIVLLEMVSAKDRSLDAAFRTAWDAVAPVVCRMQPETYEAIRSLTAAWEIACLAPRVLQDAVDLCVGQVDVVLRLDSWPKELIASHARLRSVMVLVAAERTPGLLEQATAAEMLTQRELARQTLILGIANNEILSHQVPVRAKQHDRAWDALEGALWGWPDDDRSPIWASTGTLGGAYRRLAGSFAAGRAHAPESARDAIQLIACLQPLCDLRLPLLRRLVRLLHPWENRPGLIFCLFAREREMLLEYLEDAALLPDLNGLEKGVSGAERSPHRIDPFSQSASDVQKAAKGPNDIPSWQLGHACGWLPGAVSSARTAAFHAVRNAESQTERLGQMWRVMTQNEAKLESRGEGPLFTTMFDPGIRLPARQDLLGRIAPGVLVLGLTIEPNGHLVAASVWRGSRGVEQRVSMSAATSGWRARDLLAKLHVGRLGKDTEETSAADARADAWRELVEVMSPSLEAVLGPALAEGSARIALLAPGALRPLPLLALPVGGTPLFERAASLVHVPALGHEPPTADGTVEACWLARDRADGDTCLGEAAVETLCRWFEPERIEPPTYRTRDIPEVDQLDRLGPSLASLCIYATSPAVIRPSLSNFTLEGPRGFSDKNTRGLFLPSCDVVELWTSTAGIGPLDAVLRDDRDRIPGLARDFLASGAAGVLDLAWPVCDLVKALVCERFGVVRRVQHLDGGTALREAVAATARVLSRWRAASSAFTDTEGALAWLDEERRAFARSAGLDVRAIIAFAPRHQTPWVKKLSAEALIKEACSPIHLAAFRYWSWL